MKPDLPGTHEGTNSQLQPQRRRRFATSSHTPSCETPFPAKWAWLIAVLLVIASLGALVSHASDREWSLLEMKWSHTSHHLALALAPSKSHQKKDSVHSISFLRAEDSSRDYDCSPLADLTAETASQFITIHNNNSRQVANFYLQPQWPSSQNFLFYANFASDTGRFGCYLDWIPETKMYTCDGMQYLQPGNYTIGIVLVRYQCGKPILQSMNTLDFIATQNLTYFSQFLEHIQYPFKDILQFNWTKTPLTTGSSQLAKPLCTKNHGPAGQWHKIDSANDCPPSVCSGMGLNTTIYNDEWTKSHDMAYIYTPFDCKYRFFTAEEALQCIKDKNPLFAGDSRMERTAHHLQFWMNSKIDFLALNTPMLIGLTKVLKAEEGQRLATAVNEGRPVLLNSVLHDLSNFRNTYMAISTEEVKMWYDDTMCQDCLEPTVWNCSCAVKPAPVQRYIQKLHQLKDLLSNATQKSNSSAPIFWVSINKSPPYQNYWFRDNTFGNAIDVVWAAESEAANILSGIGAQHIDLRYQTTSAPASWYPDTLHTSLGGNQLNSFKHMQIQTMLNALCS